MNIVFILLIAFIAALHLSMVEATEGGTRNMKTSKEPKKVKETKKPVDPQKCAVVKNFLSDGSFLENIIFSMFENQDFSSYCQIDFDVAKKWLLDGNNHPKDEQKNFEYMTERFTLALLHSANCKKDCKLSNKDWLTSTDHCTWTGVSCSSEKEIKELNFIRRGLSGPFTMFTLKKLERMFLTDNHLSGIFTVAGESPTLSELHLTKNKLSGIKNGRFLPNLEDLYLIVNEFTGELDVNEENFPTFITHLYLDYNKLKGIRNGGLLTNLSKLSLDNNEFTGDLKVTVKDFPTNITQLFLRNNNLTGVRGGGLLSNIQSLYLNNNEFTGKLDVTLEDFPNAQILQLQGNRLTGIHNAQNLSKLQRLYLNENELLGNIELTEESFPTSLQSIFLDRNNLTGIRIEDLFTNLLRLSLRENAFVGEFFITNEVFPKNLEWLDLSGNSGLTNVGAETDAVPNLWSLAIYVDGVKADQELCRRESLTLVPSSACEV